MGRGSYCGTGGLCSEVCGDGGSGLQLLLREEHGKSARKSGAGGITMDDQSQLDNFSLEGDQVALPKGAWAQSHRLNVRWRGRDLTALSQGAFRAYLFPVYTPAGFAVTSESPLDHPHHNSLWIGADHVNCYLPFAGGAFEEANYNFYVNDIFQGRAPGRILGVEVEADEIADDHLLLVQTLHWQGPIEWGAPERRTLAVETRTIDIRPGEVANLFDVRSQLRAAEWDLRIGPTRHAYFGLRLTEALRVTNGATMVDAEGARGGRRDQWGGFGLGGLFGHGCGGQAGRRGAVSVSERAGVSLVCGGLGDADG